MEHYQAIFEPAEEGSFVITLPDFGYTTQGDTEEEALEMAADAIAIGIQARIDESKPLPPPTQRRGRKYRSIRLPAMLAAKAELYRQFFAADIAKTEFARRLGIHKTSIDRLFDLKHHSRLDHMEAAFHALGKDIIIEVKDAA